jgi:hypothetical protein
MTSGECLDWRRGKDSWGWMVRFREKGAEWEEWDFPSQFAYDFSEFEYQRAKLLPDFSGIDESTIQGFKVEG